MMYGDFHLHTYYCDGETAPEEMVRAAIGLQMPAIGICTHSYTAFDESYCIPKASTADFIAECHALREAYAKEIRVYCGVEQDSYSGEPTKGFDYAIGSLHYLHLGDAYYPVDDGYRRLVPALEQYFDNDWIALAEEYFLQESHVIENTNADVIGHFDLITKYLRLEPVFSCADERYRRAWRQAADVLLASGRPFEINTGAMARRLREDPYPSEEIMAYLGKYHCPVLLSSDAHRPSHLCYSFDHAARLAEKHGLKIINDSFLRVSG